MAEQQHPITPPPELMEQWRNQAPPSGIERATWIATQAARWGADCELEACCEWVWNNFCSLDLRVARRPNPPSLKEHALATLQKLSTSDYPCNYQGDDDWDTLRRALESLPD